MVPIKIFVSSPGDVALEREITRKTLAQLGHEFGQHANLDPFFWEYEPQDLSQGYQAQIPKASEHHIVICIFFTRLGTPLTVDGLAYPSGSAYELLEAKAEKAARVAAGGAATPHILIFVNKSNPKVSLKDEAELEKRIRDWKALDSFLSEQTRSGDQYIGAVNRYETLQEFQEKLEAKVRRLIESHLVDHDGQLVPRPEVKWKGDPYQGLSAFQFEHAAIFFGRDVATAAVIQLFQAHVAHERSRFVMIFGASGSGKSSLARAGVIPTLMTPHVIEGIGLWRRAIMKPSDENGNLFVALATALMVQDALPELRDDGTSRETLAARLQASPEAALESIRGALRQAATTEKIRQIASLKEQIQVYTDKGYPQDVAACQNRLEQGLTAPQARLVLLVDQFEEIFTKKIPETEFMRCLRCLAMAPDGLVFMIVTIPSAYYGDAMECDGLNELMKIQGTHFPLPTPTDSELTQMIRLPALAAGLRFEERDGVALDERLLADARSNPDCLPLLEFCLAELAKTGKEQALLTHAAYKNLGMLSGVLANCAEKTLTELSSPERAAELKITVEVLSARTQAALDIVLPALIARDPNQPNIAVRRAAPWREVTATPETKKLVDAFIEARLFVSSAAADESHTTADKPEPFVSVTHEALLRHWKPAQEWIGLDASQDFLRRRERVEQSYQAWLAKKKHAHFLLPSGIQLAEAEDLIEKHPHAFEKMREYVSLSVIQHKWRRYRTIAAILLIMLMAASSFAYFTRRQADEAFAGQLVAQADRSLGQKDFARAEIALAKALTIKDSPDTRLRLWRARSGGVSLIGASRQAAKGARLSAFSPHCDLGAAIVKANASQSSTVSIFKTEDQQQVATIDLQYVPEALALGHDAGDVRYVACARPAPHFDIEIWTVELTAKTASLHRKLEKPHSKRIPSLAFHPSKPWLANCSEDQTLRLWDYSSDPARLLWEQPQAHGTNIHGIAFNHDGTLLGSGGGDYKVKVWTVDEAVRLAPNPAQSPKYVLSGHLDSVFTVAFSPDGERLASGGYDRVIRIWALRSDNENIPQEVYRPTIVNTLEGHEGTVLDLTFSDDSLLLASGSKDESIRLWQVNQGRILATLNPGCGVIRSVAYSGFGEDVYCGGEAGWSIWSVRERPEAARMWNGGATVNAIAFDPKGKYVAAGGTDGNVRIWDHEHRLHRKLKTDLPKESINGIAFDAQGRWLAAGGDKGVVHIWDREKNWQKFDVKLTHGGPVWGLCFDPEGRWLASSNSDDDICIKKWDTASWTLLTTFGESKDSIYALACYTDENGTRLVSGDADAQVIVRDATTGAVLAQNTNVEGAELNVWSVAICPNPLSVISGNSDGRVRRWVPKPNSVPLATSVAEAHVNPTINSVAYSKKYGWIAAGGDGRSVEIYDQDLKPVRSFIGQEGTVWMVAFDPEGGQLAYGGTDGMLRLWNIDELQGAGQLASPQQLYKLSQQATGLSVENGKVVPFTSGQ